MRYCADRNGRSTSCAKAHDNEGLFYWVVTGFPKGDKLSDEQWAPYDARCQRAADILIGAKRKDLTARADIAGRANVAAYGGDTATLLCFVRLTEDADLPAGTVVGLGNRPVGS